MKNIEKIEIMENMITNMIKDYKNCYFKYCKKSIMLVRCLGKTDKLNHNFKAFYHFYLKEFYINSMFWNKHTKKWINFKVNL